MYAGENDPMPAKHAARSTDAFSRWCA